MTLPKRILLAASCVAVLIGVSAAPAQGQQFSLRGGYSVDPDQIYGGGQYDFGPLADGVWLQPGAEVGRGDGATLVATSFDITYRKPLRRSGGWAGYVGGGPTINWYRLDAYHMTEMGFGALAGLMHPGGLLLDFKAGLLDNPRFRVGVGYAFRPAPPRVPHAPAPPRRP